MNQLKPNFLFSLHRHSTLRVSCGWGNAVRLEVGELGAFQGEVCPVGSPSWELKSRDPSALVQGHRPHRCTRVRRPIVRSIESCRFSIESALQGLPPAGGPHSWTSVVPVWGLCLGRHGEGSFFPGPHLTRSVSKDKDRCVPAGSVANAVSTAHPT